MKFGLPKVERILQASRGTYAAYMMFRQSVLQKGKNKLDVIDYAILSFLLADMYRPTTYTIKQIADGVDLHQNTVRIHLRKLLKLNRYVELHRVGKTEVYKSHAAFQPDMLLEFLIRSLQTLKKDQSKEPRFVYTLERE